MVRDLVSWIRRLDRITAIATCLCVIGAIALGLEKSSWAAAVIAVLVAIYYARRGDARPSALDPQSALIEMAKALRVKYEDQQGLGSDEPVQISWSMSRRPVFDHWTSIRSDDKETPIQLAGHF